MAKNSSMTISEELEREICISFRFSASRGDLSFRVDSDAPRNELGLISGVQVADVCDLAGEGLEDRARIIIAMPTLKNVASWFDILLCPVLPQRFDNDVWIRNLGMRVICKSDDPGMEDSTHSQPIKASYEPHIQLPPGGISLCRIQRERKAIWKITPRLGA